MGFLALRTPLQAQRVCQRQKLMLRSSCSLLSPSSQLGASFVTRPLSAYTITGLSFLSSRVCSGKGHSKPVHKRLAFHRKAMAKPDDPSQVFHSGQAKARSALDEMSNTGEFKRTDSTYRDHVQKGTRFEPEGTDCVLQQVRSTQALHSPLKQLHAALHATWLLLTAAGRYHLYIAYACPWASRCLAVRNLKVLLSVEHVTSYPKLAKMHCESTNRKSLMMVATHPDGVDDPQTLNG